MMLTAGAKKWADVREALELLREVRGFERARLPEAVMEHMTRKEQEAEHQWYTAERGSGESAFVPF